MRLFEHPDFGQAILRAAEHFEERGLRAAIIEKDYYVTEALRAIQQTAPDAIIFEGGTSLSKGWDIIQRFSEDIDIFLDPQASEPHLGKKAVDRHLKRLRDAVAHTRALTFLPGDSMTIGGRSRNDWFRYEQRFGGAGEVAGRVLLESGIGSGREPTQTVQLRSYLGEFLQQTGVSFDAEDEASFPMRLLHFRRTFVEKMFAIHKKVELLKRDAAPVGVHARHYYDLFQLAGRDEVLAMLRSDEYAQIKADYDRISRAFFPEHYFFPEGMNFAKSDAIFPPAALSEVLGRDYEQQCRVLCYSVFPSWEEVQARFAELRTLL